MFSSNTQSFVLLVLGPKQNCLKFYSMFFFLSVDLLMRIMAVFFSVLDMEMHRKHFLYSLVASFCLIPKVFQGYNIACKTIFIMLVELNRIIDVSGLSRPWRIYRLLQRVF